MRSELQTSNDVGLVGTAALDVVELAIRKASGHEGGSWDFSALRTTATELVTRAETLDPQNQHVLDIMGGSGRWSDLMEGVKGLPGGPVPWPPSPAPPSSPPAAPQVVRIGEGVAASLLQESSKAVYPPTAKAAGVQGTVKLEVRIGGDGHVTDIKIVSGHPLLVPAAIDAVKSYVYKPFLINGNAVDVISTVEVKFEGDGAGDKGAADSAFPAQSPPETKFEIAELTIEGATDISTADQNQIAASIKQRTYSCSDLDGARDEVLERIRMAWQDRGYFKVVVSDGARMLTSGPGSEHIAVAARVDEGQQYRLAGITFKNNRVVDSRILRNLFPIKEDGIFSREKIATGLENLRKAYGERGYISANLVPGTRFDDEKKLAYLDIDLEEGKQFYVSSVGFLGADEHALQNLLRLKPGDIYNQRMVDLFFEEQASLLPAGASRSSNVHLQPDDQAGRVAITFDLRQRPAQ